MLSFWVLPSPIFDFTGVTALQAASECPRAARRVLGKRVYLNSYEVEVEAKAELGNNNTNLSGRTGLEQTLS